MFELTGIVLVIVVLLVIAAAATIGWYVFMKARYRTVPSNEALIVTGPKLGDETKETNIWKDDQGRYMKVVRGGGVRLRMFQTGTRVSLKSFQLQIKTPKVYTSEGVGIYGQAVATVKVSDDLHGIVKYAEQFLGKAQEEIEDEISEVLNANLRAILSKMTVEEINGHREKFNDQVRDVAQEQLDRMGFHITSLGLSDLSDDDNYLENLGRPQTAAIKKNAEIAEANARRETEINKAEVDEDIALENNKREISIAESRKEKDLKDAANLAQTERERANSEAAYALQVEERKLEIEQQRLRIREQDQAKELELMTAKRENDVLLEKQHVEIRRQQADADAYAKEKDAIAIANARKVEGEAEADVIRNKALAEAEAIEKRADAMAKHQDVLIQELMIQNMPKIAHELATAFTNVESIRIMDNGSGSQLQSLPNTIMNMMAQLEDNMDMTDFDAKNLFKGMSGIFDKDTNVENAIFKAVTEAANDNHSDETLDSDLDIEPIK